MNNEFDHIRNQVIGTVEFVSPREIKVLLDINAPQSTAINTGIPQLFPKVNGFVLIPNEGGALVCMISWIGIEYSPYPKRKGYKDFDLIDLPFPLRKLSLCPLGLLKENDGILEVERGVYSFPSVGDAVVIPDQKQLRAIVQNKDEKAAIKIGTSPLAANAPVYVNPDRLFGRHIAVLGNTGSGKSCSVAGLIRWSLEAVSAKSNEKCNARFIVLDPNDEYKACFESIATIRKFQVKINEDSDAVQLKVPSWMWNSYEWGAIAQASGKTQRPILRRALREVKGSGQLSDQDVVIAPKRTLISFLISLNAFERAGISAYATFPGKQNLGELLSSAKESLNSFLTQLTGDHKTNIENIIKAIDIVLRRRPKNNGGYFPAFDLTDINEIRTKIQESAKIFGELKPYEGPNEDSPAFFEHEDFISHIERLAQENNAQQYMDFFLMRVKSIITDPRISSVIDTKTKDEISLEDWLKLYIGTGAKKGEIVIIDLSLVPSEILHVIVAVLSRIIFEAHQRYRRSFGKVLPTTLVVEEAHNFIRKYEDEADEISSSRLCAHAFEKIAKEGRKFGLGLVISSQRPSELSQTVLSQCNTFLLHRLVNDRDQEMVRKLVPDNLGSILNELPILPTRKAILLGWATPIPVVVEMNHIPKSWRPESNDPEYWDVWTGATPRDIDWKKISSEWQKQ